jgi:hypothetical protein
MNQNSPLNEKIYQKNLREYVKTLFESLKGRGFKNEPEERKLYVHMQRILDCLALEDVFQFEKNGVIFNFHNYYEEPQRCELEKLRKEVAKRMSFI